jgi:hypothetical protein
MLTVVHAAVLLILVKAREDRRAALVAAPLVELPMRIPSFLRRAVHLFRLVTNKVLPARVDSHVRAMPLVNICANIRI